MNIQKFSDYLLNSNSYLVYDNGEAVLIDCGACMEKIYQFIYVNELSLKAIILTHSHLDHSYFACEASKKTGAPIYCHTDEVRVLFDPDGNVSKLFGMELDTDFEPRLLNEGDKITVGNSELEIIHTPGHTPGSICLINTENGVIFTGDTMFCGTYGRTNFKYGSHADMSRSLQKICSLDADLTVYSGHGEETTVGRERKTYGF